MCRRGSPLVKNGPISPPVDPTGPVPEATEPEPPKRRSPAGRAMRSTVMVLLFLFVVFYLVIPRWGAQEATARQLRNVNPVLLLVALGLAVSSLIAYAVLTKVTLPREPKLSLFTIFRIQLATRAVTNVVPGGSAAGSTLGYRLFTQAGVPPTAAGFTMATVGIGSAVVLNLILWVALLISIPLKGFKQAYVSAALIGVLLMGAAAFLVWSLMEGRGQAEKVLRAIFRRIPFVKEETGARFVHQLADRLHDLARQPELIRQGVVWAALNWMLDAAALWVFLRAFEESVDPIVLIVAYGVAQVAAAIPITPGGLGVVEAALPATLVGFGVDNGAAVAGVLSWRFAQFWLPIPLGGLSYLSIRFGRIGRKYAKERDEAEPRFKLSTVAGRRVWDDETGEYRWIRDNGEMRLDRPDPGEAMPPGHGVPDHRIRLDRDPDDHTDDEPDEDPHDGEDPEDSDDDRHQNPT